MTLFLREKNQDTRRVAVLLFLIGLFTETRINLGGSIAIAELVMTMLAPIVLVKEWPVMRRYGVSTIVLLAILWLCGAVFSDFYNGTYIRFAMKGIATPIVFIASMVCLFSLLRRNILNFKWLILGFALSYVFATFFFSRASSLEVEEIAKNSFEYTIGYKLYWLNLASNILLLPIKGWFMSTPFIYSCLATLGFAGANLLGGARSMFISSMVSFLFIFVARKSAKTMMAIKRYFVLFCVGLIVMIGISKIAYKRVAKAGLMGDDELVKYEQQTKVGESTLNLLMAGRIEFFVGGFAACRRPLIGRGSWALDYEGIYPEFLSKYGSQEDFERFRQKVEMKGDQLRIIPFHTHIITYWMWHGVFGLMFFVYVGWLTFSTLKNNISVIPGLYGYFVLTIPAFLWDLFFSPVGLRVQESALYVICLLVRYYAKRKKLGYICA